MSENQDLLLQLTKDVLGEPTAGHTTTVAAAPDALRATWQTVANLGWPLVSIPESAGGAGGSIGDLTALMRGFGRAGTALPLRHSAMAAWVHQHTGTRPDGRRAVVQVRDSLEGHSNPRLDESTGATFTISGELELPWGEQADLVLLLVRDSPGTTLVLDPRSDGVVRTPLAHDVADEPRARLTLDQVTVEMSHAGPSTSEVQAREALLDAAALLGAAEATYDLTLRHAEQRTQFDRALRSLPAVKSALARMNVALELTKTAVSRALARAETAGEGIDRTAAMAAHAMAADSATEIAATAHQLHGAVGTTLEYPLHLLTRRLWSWRDINGAHHDELVHLGTEASESGEDALWDVLTENDLDPACEATE